ncbi:MAG TPA: ABC transporter ATP-binding protein/permease [Burkholderiales bacterium]|nr:ABC transporter ATP-binding protein/permease [Burkholderiales bacterium]
MPLQSASKKRDHRDVLLKLFRAAWAYRGRAFGALSLLVLAKVAAVFVPIVLKQIVDDMSRPEDVLTLPVFLLIGYALLRFSGTLFNELRDLLFSRVTQRTVADYAIQAFTQLHALGPRYHSNRRTGALLRDIDRGASGIAFLMGVGLFTIIPTFVEIGLVLAIMLANYSAWFAVIILTTFLLYASFTIAFTARRTIYQRRVNKFDSNAKSRLADSLINYEAVKYFTNESLEAQRFRSIMSRWTEAAVNNQKALFILHVGQSAIIGAGVASVMLLAGQGVVDNAMTVGDLVLINAYVIQICLPLNALGFVYRETKDALTNAENLFKLLAVKPDIDDSPEASPLRIKGAEVTFENVNFGYQTTRPILRDITFRIPSGKTVAVVGGSGSGKSTLARILLRFHDPNAGRILIDGQDIATVEVKSLRAAIGVVPQDTALFNDTIAYNIGYGRVTASREEIIEAAHSAHVHDFIQSLPLKYETMVGERGMKLSGGEKQRIAIARAILKNPPILIFDEATSALDSYSEQAIQMELNRISRNRTTLIIAHRLSTIIRADEILVLQQGRIIERGTHARLLLKNGVYAQMWMLQQRARKLEETTDVSGDAFYINPQP